MNENTSERIRDGWIKWRDISDRELGDELSLVVYDQQMHRQFEKKNAQAKEDCGDGNAQKDRCVANLRNLGKE